MAHSIPVAPSALVLFVVAKVLLGVVMASLDVAVVVDRTDFVIPGWVVTPARTELSVVVENVSLDFESESTAKGFVLSKKFPSYDCK